MQTFRQLRAGSAWRCLLRECPKWPELFAVRRLVHRGRTRAARNTAKSRGLTPSVPTHLSQFCRHLTGVPRPPKRFPIRPDAICTAYVRDMDPFYTPRFGPIGTRSCPWPRGSSRRWGQRLPRPGRRPGPGCGRSRRGRTGIRSSASRWGRGPRPRHLQAPV